MNRSLIRPFAVICLLGLALATQTQARDRRQSQAGQFDFYVLSLSWSPSFCAETAERHSGRAPRAECATGAYSFIVHGLWPQNEHGYPENCERPAPRLSRAIVSAMLDLMVSPRLVYGEWDRHGTCSGLSTRDYFAAIRKARSQVTIPPQYRDPRKPLDVGPAAVEDAFVKANPGLTTDDIAVECEADRLTEVRLCLSKDLKYRACPDVVRHSCRRDDVLMPPVSGEANPR